MAPPPEAEAYFPSLDKCFSGDAQIIPWKTAFLRLSNPGFDVEKEDDLYKFLAHPDSERLLRRRFNPFQEPSAQTKSEFESKTAAINVTSGSKARHDISEIKDDSLWLSKEAKIDEISALRVVVLEWQLRPSVQLCDGFSEEETTSLQDAAGVDDFRISMGGAQVAEILQLARTQRTDATEFTSKDRRHRRQLHLYMSEKMHILKVAQLLLSISLRDQLPSSFDTGNAGDVAATSTGVRELGRSIFERPTGVTANVRPDSTLSECIAALRPRLEGLNAGSGFLKAEDGDGEVEEVWAATCLQEMTCIVHILFFVIQRSADIPSADSLLAWLRLLSQYGLLELSGSANPEHDLLFPPLMSIISTTTLAFLKLTPSLEFVDDFAAQKKDAIPENAPYFMSRDHIGEINEIFLKVASGGLPFAGPAVFAWGIILHTVRELALVAKEDREMLHLQSAVDSFQSNIPSQSRVLDQSLLEDLLDRVHNPGHGEDPIQLLAIMAVDRCRAFDTIQAVATLMDLASNTCDLGVTSNWIRLTLLELVRLSMSHVGYMKEVITSVICILSGSDKKPHWTTEPARIKSDPRIVFLEDPMLMVNVFDAAKSRMPYEAFPFLKLCRALSGCGLLNEDGLPFVANMLESMDYYTECVPPDFHGYETIREDENANFVSLVQPLSMIHPSSTKNLTYGAESAYIQTSHLSLPPSTVGQVMSDSRPAVIRWQHNYPGLYFLGTWLEYIANELQSEIDDDVPTEIIGLFADLLSAAHKTASEKGIESSTKRILEMASEGLDDRSGDIVSVVFDILERALQDIDSRPNSNRRLDSILSCLRFVQAMAQALPSRVWSYLSRSSLLGTDGKGGMISTVVAALEIPLSDFSFLLHTIDIFGALVDDAVIHAAARRNAGRVSPRSTNGAAFHAGVPSHVISNVLLAFLRSMVEVYNSSLNWSFKDPEQRLHINSSLAKTFERILYYTYSIDDSTDLQSKITGIFAKSAPYILSVLRPTSKEELPVNPVLSSILEGLQTPGSTADVRTIHLLAGQTVSSLELAIRLVQAGRLTESPPSMLEDQLFKAAPVLIKLYALLDDYRLPVITLLDLLVSRAAQLEDTEPPSLFGHLGARASCLFLDVLSKFDGPLKDTALYVGVWQILSTIVSKRQQWLAIYLLTGTSPREALKQKFADANGTAMRGKPFLQIALDLLSSIETASPRTALSALEFVSRAQENWPWATPELQKHTSFLRNIINYTSNLDLKNSSTEDQCLNSKIAGIVADICGVYLHSAKDAKDMTFFKTLIPLVSWFGQNAVEVSGYNASLQSNLKKNFKMKYPSCSLTDLKRTTLEMRGLGPDYFYNVEMGSKMFGYDFAWHGNRNQGFADEVERANLNLSLVEAQVGLLNSFKFFAIEHCVDFMSDRDVRESMARVVRNCLVANSKSTPQEPIFDKLRHSRVEFAMALIQRLADVRASGSEVFKLLGVAWNTMRSGGLTFETALLNDDADYYRSLLNVVFLALQFHATRPAEAEAANKKPEISSDMPIILEIVKVVVAQGFRTLTTYLHDEPQKCAPKDFAILTAILQTTLRTKNADRLYEQIVYHFADNDIARYATTLYSWSDQLTVEGDPVFGELSILFLLEMSSIPMMAEYLAVEGVLMKLSTYRLTNILRQRQGCGPFDSVPRLYAIWTNGILPLCLNLLFHVGRAAPEIAAFLNQFEAQLNRATEMFAGTPITSRSGKSPKRISLSMASEASSLALISFILQKFCEAGPSAGMDTSAIQELKWNKTNLKDDIEELLSRRQILRSRIVSTSAQELELMKKKPIDVSSGADNQLEERIVKEFQGALNCMAGGEEA